MPRVLLQLRFISARTRLRQLASPPLLWSSTCRKRSCTGWQQRFEGGVRFGFGIRDCQPRSTPPLSSFGSSGLLRLRLVLP
jgi:hypothetical protein